MSISDKLTTIAENEQKVYDAGRWEIIKSSKYLRGFASGNTITLNDVAPIEHELGITLSSKNKIVYPYLNASGTTNGVTVTVNPDGSLTCNGTATASTNFNVVTSSLVIPWGVVPYNEFTSNCNTYTLSLGYEGVYTGNIRLYVHYYPLGSSGGASYAGWLNATIGGSMSDKAPRDMQGIRAYINFPSGTTMENLRLLPQLELGETPTPFTNYIEYPDVNIPMVIVSAEDDSGNIQTVGAPSDSGIAEGVFSASPNMTITTSISNIAADVKYYRA